MSYRASAMPPFRSKKNMELVLFPLPPSVPRAPVTRAVAVERTNSDRPPGFPAFDGRGGRMPGKAVSGQTTKSTARPAACPSPCRVSRTCRPRISSRNPSPASARTFCTFPTFPCTTRTLADASGGGCRFPMSHPAPFIRSRIAAAAPRSRAPFRSFRCSHAERRARFRNRVRTSSPSNPTYSASWNAGSPAPSHGYPRFHGKIMGTVRPQSAMRQGRRPSWAVLERWRRSRSRAKASPARTK